MIEDIDRDIYRIAVPLEGSPLGSLNAYYFRGSEAEYLMDTGFRTPQCESALRLALDALGWHPERLKGLDNQIASIPGGEELEHVITLADVSHLSCRLYYNLEQEHLLIAMDDISG